MELQQLSNAKTFNKNIMTEKDYIKAKALGTITASIDTLRDLVPESLDGVVTTKEYSLVMETLRTWQERLFEQIEITK